MPVEVVGVALRLDHRLAAAAGAADEVRVLGIAAVVATNDALGRFGGEVDRPMAEVQLALLVAEGPISVGPHVLVPRVGPDRGITTLQRSLAEQR